MFRLKLGKLLSNPNTRISEPVSISSQIPFSNLNNSLTTINRTETPTLIDQEQITKCPPLRAIGVRPIAPHLYFDIDTQYENIPELNIVNKEMLPQWIITNNPELFKLQEIYSLIDRLRLFIQMKERHFFYAKLNHYHWCIYKTKHGWQYVHQFPTFDRVQYALREMKTVFPRSNYIMNCRKLRLRISPKWNPKEAILDNKFNAYPKEVSYSPIIYEHCNCDIWKLKSFTELSINNNTNILSKDLRYGLKELYATYD